MTKVYKYYYTPEGDIDYKIETLKNQAHLFGAATDLPFISSTQDVKISQYTVNPSTLELEQTKTPKPKPVR
jgi:hypothetical protein